MAGGHSCSDIRGSALATQTGWLVGGCGSAEVTIYALCKYKAEMNHQYCYLFSKPTNIPCNSFLEPTTVVGRGVVGVGGDKVDEESFSS